jgi:hypothetical protein
MKHGREAIDLFLEERLDCLGGYVTAGKACTSGRNDNVDNRIGDPVLNLSADLGHIILHERSVRHLVTGCSDQLH